MRKRTPNICLLHHICCRRVDLHIDVKRRALRRAHVTWEMDGQDAKLPGFDLGFDAMLQLTDARSLGRMRRAAWRSEHSTHNQCPRPSHRPTSEWDMPRPLQKANTLHGTVFVCARWCQFRSVNATLNRGKRGRTMLSPAPSLTRFRPVWAEFMLNRVKPARFSWR